MTTRTLILSSSSPARRDLLERLQIPFTVVSPDIDESPKHNEIPFEMVKRLAIEKAKKSAEQFPDALIIGCDQVGTIDAKVLTKPLEHDNAVQQLKFVSGKTVRFLTGICLYDAKTQYIQHAVETYDVHFRKLSESTIKHYLEKEDALFCAGSFHVEGLGIALIEKLAGDDYTALIGLPLIRLTEMLGKVHAEVL